MTSQALSPALEKKRAQKEERLQSHYETYINDVNARRTLAAASSDPSESVDAFLASFAHSRDQVEDKLSAILSRKPTKLDEAGLESVREELKSLQLEIINMGTLLANSSFYLPTYSIQSSQTSILKLKEEVEAASTELLPKKKFSFRNKTAKPTKDTEKIKETQPAVPVSVSDSKPSIPLPSFYGIQDEYDCTLIRYAQDLEDREFMLSNLTNCKVYLEGKCRALYVNKLRNCQVYTGPVTASVLIDDVEGSTLMLASQQIRIHSTKNTDFYLRVRSRPIVEYTSSVRFAPYAFHYSGIEDALQAANLLEETGEWENVDDFRWLRAVQSPNWSILPPSERVSVNETDFADRTTSNSSRELNS